MARKRSEAQSTPSRFQEYRPVLDVLIFALALFGVLVTVHLWIQQNRGFDQGCFGFSASQAVEESFNCEAVVTSSAGQFLGLSNVFWGLLFYLGVLGLSTAIAFAIGSTLRQLKIGRFTLLTTGLVYSLYLAFYQYAVIQEFCALCLTSAVTVTVLFVLQLVDFLTTSNRKGSTMPFARKMRQSGVYLSLFVLTVLLIGADVVYFNSLEEPEVVRAQPEVAGTPQPVAAEMPDGVCVFNPEIQPVENYADMVSFSDPVRGSTEADVMVIEFFDPNCGHCRTFHPTMKQIISEHGDEAQFYIRPFVLNPQSRSMAQVEALYAAAQEGKYFEMLDHQFARQQPGGLTIEQLKAIATEIGMNPDEMEQKINRGVFKSTIMKLRQQIVAAGISSVPAVMVNGRVIATQSRNKECIEKFISAAAAS